MLTALNTNDKRCCASFGIIPQPGRKGKDGLAAGASEGLVEGCAKQVFWARAGLEEPVPGRKLAQQGTTDDGRRRLEIAATAATSPPARTDGCGRCFGQHSPAVTTQAIGARHLSMHLFAKLVLHTGPFWL